MIYVHYTEYMALKDRVTELEKSLKGVIERLERSEEAAEDKVMTKSGRPVHKDTVRTLAQIYVDALERAGMPVPQDVIDQAEGK